MTTPQAAWPDWVSNLAQRFHDTYEALAPKYGYSTAERSRVPWAECDDNLRGLMCETVRLTVGIDPTNMAAALAQRDAQIEPLERAIRATRHSLTEHARYDVLTYLTCEVDDPIAADVWHELAITKFDAEDPHA